ncbi:MAG: SdiA-regulated domain-containing protein [Bacteroidota bacterium]
MYRVLGALLVIWIAFASTHCGPSTPYSIADSLYLINNAPHFYDLKKPTEKHFLPYVLSEISGLTFTRDGQLICVEDEGGKVYFYDPQLREIVHSIRFWGPGDFEGVELVNDTVYVLESNGDLFQFPLIDGKEVKATKIETELRRANNAEGLAYDPLSHSLLIACKDDPGIGDEEVVPRAIYAYDLRTQELTTRARFIISKEQLIDFFQSAERGYEYDPLKIKFKPSGIAFHPLDQTFYVLASVGKLLLTMDAKGNIIASYPISARVLNQPEGIAFASNGDLYLSSEGEGDRGYILRFPKVIRGTN